MAVAEELGSVVPVTAVVSLGLVIRVGVAAGFGPEGGVAAGTGVGRDAAAVAMAGVSGSGRPSGSVRMYTYGSWRSTAVWICLGGKGNNFNALAVKFVVYKVQNDGHHGPHTISSFLEWSPCVGMGMSGRDGF